MFSVLYKIKGIKLVGCHVAKFVIFLILSGFMYLFTSCDSEDISGSQGKLVLPPESEKIVVNFSVSELGFGDSEAVARSASPAASPNPSSRRALSFPLGGVRWGYEETVAVPLTEDIYMYATLKEADEPVSLRASSP